MLKLNELKDWEVPSGHAIPHSEYSEVIKAANNTLPGYHPQGPALSAYKTYTLKTKYDAARKRVFMESTGGWSPPAEQLMKSLNFVLRRFRVNDGTGNTPPRIGPVSPPIDIPIDREYFYLVAEGDGSKSQLIDGYQMLRWEIHAAEEIVEGMGTQVRTVYEDYIYWKKPGEHHHGSDDEAVRTSWRWIQN